MATKTTTKEKKAPVSLDAVVYSQKGTKAGTIALPEKVFGLKWNADLVHEVIHAMMANKRSGTAHTKDRSEVSGGGKKPWKQKGTGRARHGSTRSPIWVGGGTTHGPRNDKDYSQKINKKARVKALFNVLSRQYATGAMLFVDDISLSTIKTKDAVAVLTNLAKIESFEKLTSEKRTGTLMIVPELTETLSKSFANFPGVTLVTAADLNPLIASTFRHLVVVNPSAAVAVLESKLK
jgi:large subunit ribosomal protein L4